MMYLEMHRILNDFFMRDLFHIEFPFINQGIIKQEDQIFFYEFSRDTSHQTYQNTWNCRIWIS